MTHEEALERLVCQGPVPLEALSHVESCAPCREELRALGKTEKALRRARPVLSAPSRKGTVLALESLPALARRRAWPAAAAAILLAGLLGGWSLGRLAPASAATTAPPQEMALSEIPWAPSGDDSTLSLLQAAYPVAERFSAVTATDTGNFIEAE